MFFFGPVQQIVVQLEITVAAEIGRDVQYHLCKQFEIRVKIDEKNKHSINIIFVLSSHVGPECPRGQSHLYELESMSVQ